jgi:hypothetical protein
MRLVTRFRDNARGGRCEAAQLVAESGADLETLTAFALVMNGGFVCGQTVARSLAALVADALVHRQAKAAPPPAPEVPT